MFTVNANKYHVNNYTYNFWKLKTKWPPFGQRKCNKFPTYFGHNSLIFRNCLTNETSKFSAENTLSNSVHRKGEI